MNEQYVTKNELQELKVTIDTRFDYVAERFNEMDKKFEEVDANFAKVWKRFDQVDRRLDGIDKRIDGLRDEIHYNGILYEKLADDFKIRFEYLQGMIEARLPLVNK